MRFEPTIGIVDYGSGNISALVQALKCISIENVILKNKSQIKHESYSHIILPGVGRFDKSMNVLKKNNLINPIIDVAKSGKFPILGICLGMHLMADFSYEGECKGLSLIPGEVKPLRSLNIRPVPHMGWNNLLLSSYNHKKLNSKITNLFNNFDYFYFIHSFFFEVTKKENCLAYSNYFRDFPVAVFKDNIIGVQFHPEKSHSSGLNLIKNFAKLSC